MHTFKERLGGGGQIKETEEGSYHKAIYPNFTRVSSMNNIIILKIDREDKNVHRI